LHSNFGFWAPPRRRASGAIVMLVSYEAAAPTAVFRAGGVQRNAAPNLFQTLIEATADVR
jgi:hypothetical protein